MTENRNLPPYRGHFRIDRSNADDWVTQVPGGYRFRTPDWVSDLIIIQANIPKVTPEGTFAAAVPVLDHLVRTGVNALWVCPFFENRGNANTVSHYGNHGPQTLADDCFRATDYTGKQKELQAFVRAAHERNIYVFLDVVTYGLLAASPIYQAYRNGTDYDGMDVSDWFTGKPLYSGYAFDWKSRSLQEWFADRMTDLIRLYDFDGFRVDSEPFYLWYDSDGDGEADRYADIFSQVRLRVAGFEKQPDGSFRYPENGNGRLITVFSEKNNLRDHGYDFEQYGVIHYGKESILRFQISGGLHHNWFAERDLAEDVLCGHIADGKWFESGLKCSTAPPSAFRYYTYCISNHDYHSTAVDRKLWIPVYQAILAPFLPIWYLGEECGLTDHSGTWLNGIPVRTDELLEDPENAAFYDSFRRAIAIRRGYPELFLQFPDDLRQTNVAGVSCPDFLGYARFSAAHTALVLANPSDTGRTGRVRIPAALLRGEVWTDLMNGNAVRADGEHTVTCTIPANGVAVLYC